MTLDMTNKQYKTLPVASVASLSVDLWCPVYRHIHGTYYVSSKKLLSHTYCCNWSWIHVNPWCTMDWN